jgi:hypothetical protein
VIPVEEAVYWILAAGQLQKARVTVVPNRGQEVVFSGLPLMLGEPVQAAQINARRDTACVVVRALNSSGCRAVAFDLHSGVVRWQRQLGLVPARGSTADLVAPPVAQGDRFVLVDEEGGIVAVPTTGAVPPGEVLSVPADWVIAPAPANATGPTVVTAAAGGAVVYTVTPVEHDGPKFLIRRIAGGKLVHTDETRAPAPLAGQPALTGDDLLLPTGDGFIYRVVPGDGRVRPGTLDAGPRWLIDRKPTGAVCAITPLSNSSFATSDGGKRLNRWDWPAGTKWNPSGTWELRDVAGWSGVVVQPAEPGGVPRLVVADASGSVWLFAADKPGQELRRWRPGGKSILPVGKPSSGVSAQPAGAGRVVAAYTVDGKFAAAIDPDGEDPLWAIRTGTDPASILVGSPQPAGANRWILTDLAGRVVLVDGTTGTILARQSVGLPGAVPSAPSGVAANSTLTPLSDGSAVLLELPSIEN